MSMVVGSRMFIAEAGVGGVDEDDDDVNGIDVDVDGSDAGGAV